MVKQVVDRGEPIREDPFARSDRAKTWSVQDWFENSEGWYSGQTGQFIENTGKHAFLPVELSLLDPKHREKRD